MVVTTEGFVRVTGCRRHECPAANLRCQRRQKCRAVPGNLLTRLLPVVMVVAVVRDGRPDVRHGWAADDEQPAVPDVPDDDAHVDGGDVRRGTVGETAANARPSSTRNARTIFAIWASCVVGSATARRSSVGRWPGATRIPLRRMTSRAPAGCGERRSGTPISLMSGSVSAHRLALRLMPPEVGPSRIWNRCRWWHCAGSSAPIRWCTACPPRCRCAAFRPSPSVDHRRTRSLVRAMLISLAVAHPPDQLRIAVVTADPAGRTGTGSNGFRT